MKDRETWEETMTDIDDAPLCARSEDLVAYLYGEPDEAAAQDFEAHTEHCAACRKELAAFGQVRLSIGEWREQALGALLSTITTASAPVIMEHVRVAPERKRSALAALREFFSLSPMWMRAGVATLGIVFCALCALSIARYFEQPKTVTVEKIVRVNPSDEELARMIEERIKQKGGSNAPATEVVPPDATASQAATFPKDRVSPRVKQNSKQNIGGQPNLAAVRGPKISPRESREIARDLRLIASKDEDDLPRLSDLIDESN